MMSLVDGVHWSASGQRAPRTNNKSPIKDAMLQDFISDLQVLVIDVHSPNQHPKALFGREVECRQ